MTSRSLDEFPGELGVIRHILPATVPGVKPLAPFLQQSPAHTSPPSHRPQNPPLTPPTHPPRSTPPQPPTTLPQTLQKPHQDHPPACADPHTHHPAPQRPRPTNAHPSSPTHTHPEWQLTPPTTRPCDPSGGARATPRAPPRQTPRSNHRNHLAGPTPDASHLGHRRRQDRAEGKPWRLHQDRDTARAHRRPRATPPTSPQPPGPATRTSHQDGCHVPRGTWPRSGDL